ncbi:hypothetical protein D3C71_1723940 [compost metagenome]
MHDEHQAKHHEQDVEGIAEAGPRCRRAEHGGFHRQDERTETTAEVDGQMFLLRNFPEHQPGPGEGDNKDRKSKE